MLKGINKNLTGDILKVLCDMGHGDVLILADANFPGASIAEYTTYGEVIHAPGIGVAELYEAIHELFPVDVAYTENPVCVMELTDGDKKKGMPEPQIWADFLTTLQKDHPDAKLGSIERTAFYDRSREAYAVIQTGEERLYGNLLLVKGVVV